MKILYMVVGACLAASVCVAELPKQAKFSKTQLYDKIKGGWAGQMIGCSYGGPTEFKFKFKRIPDDYEIPWKANNIIKATNLKGDFSGLYDDLYLDITFMDILERFGLDAPRREFKKAIAESKYPLWCANRQARVEYLDGMDPDAPVSWKTNINSNDIDFQIESDFAGLMSPALPQAALKYADTVGRAINGGEGFYCGAYVATMYSLAFVFDNPRDVVVESMKILPKKSLTYKIVSSISDYYAKNPNDWKSAWQMFTDKFCTSEIRSGLGNQNIYAPYNLAYIIIGLLYGNGDFGKTADISTRCGLDSDCNPSNACGILGAIQGYSKIPEKWLAPLRQYESTVFFTGTTYTCEKVYAVGFSHAIQTLKNHGAKVSNDGNISVEVKMPAPIPFEYEPKLTKISNVKLPVLNAKNTVVESEIDGLVVSCTIDGLGKKSPHREIDGICASVECWVDGKKVRTANFYFDEFKYPRNHELFRWTTEFDGKHKVRFELKNPHPKFEPLNLSLHGFKVEK